VGKNSINLDSCNISPFCIMGILGGVDIWPTAESNMIGKKFFGEIIMDRFSNEDTNSPNISNYLAKHSCYAEHKCTVVRLVIKCNASILTLQ